MFPGPAGTVSTLLLLLLPATLAPGVVVVGAAVVVLVVRTAVVVVRAAVVVVGAAVVVGSGVVGAKVVTSCTVSARTWGPGGVRTESRPKFSGGITLGIVALLLLL